METGVDEGPFIQGRLRFEDSWSRPFLQFVVDDLRANHHRSNRQNCQATSYQQSYQADTYLGCPKHSRSGASSFQVGEIQDEYPACPRKRYACSDDSRSLRIERFRSARSATRGGESQSIQTQGTPDAGLDSGRGSYALAYDCRGTPCEVPFGSLQGPEGAGRSPLVLYGGGCLSIGGKFAIDRDDATPGALATEGQGEEAIGGLRCQTPPSDRY